MLFIALLIGFYRKFQKKEKIFLKFLQAFADRKEATGLIP